jgi:hypothetical protein
VGFLFTLCLCETGGKYYRIEPTLKLLFNSHSYGSTLKVRERVILDRFGTGDVRKPHRDRSVKKELEKNSGGGVTLLLDIKQLKT